MGGHTWLLLAAVLGLTDMTGMGAVVRGYRVAPNISASLSLLECWFAEQGG